MKVALLVENAVPFVTEEVAALRNLGLSVSVASVFRPQPASLWERRFAGPVLYPRPGRAQWALRTAREGAATPRAMVQLTRRARREGAPLRLVSLAAQLARRARREGWSHFHGNFATFPAWTAWAAAQLAGLPFSFTGHAYDVQRPRPWLARLIGEASFVRAISNETAGRLRCIAPEAGDAIRVGFLGVDVQQFAPAMPVLPAGPLPEIVATAQLVPKKGLEVLIDAAALLDRQGRAFQLRILGDGPLRTSLEQRVHGHGLSRRVRLEGAAEPGKVARALRGASLFALPCVVDSTGEHDGIPVAILEAMASGLPVVSTPVGGIGDAIEHDLHGCLVPPGDAFALAAALAGLLDDPGRRASLGAAARERVLQRFRLDQSAEQLARWMGESLSERSRSATRRRATLRGDATIPDQSAVR